MKGMDFLWVGLIVLGAGLLALVVWQSTIEQPLAKALVKGGSTEKGAGG